MKTISSFIILHLLFSLSLFSQYDKMAEEMLKKVEAKYKSLKSFKAEFTYTGEMAATDEVETLKGKIIVKGSNKVILDLFDQVIYIDGQTQWTHLVEENEVDIMDYDPDEEEFSPNRMFDLYKRGFKYIYIEDITEKGKVLHVIDLVPEDRNKSFFKIKLFINKADNTIAAWRIYEKNANKYEYRINAFFPDIKVEDSDFRFDPSKYKGIEVVDLR
jgi:outer membrane lipoprotein carrier protein